jgi:hypothetical protein
MIGIECSHHNNEDDHIFYQIRSQAINQLQNSQSVE